MATQLRDAPLRQRSVSVRAALEGSWNRLSLAERSVLRRPSVFRGGFTRQAASEVAGATLPVLAALVDKSLLRVSDRGRYDRHLLISGYTQEKLAEVAQEEAQTKEAYGAYFLKLVEAAEPRLKTGQQKVWLERLEEEFGNLRAAFGLFVDGEVTINEAPKLASALHHFWRFRHAREGRAWLERVLEHGRCYQHAEARAKACRTAGDISSSARGLRAGHRLSRESLALRRRTGDRLGAAKALGGLANLILERGDAGAAEATCARL